MEPSSDPQQWDSQHLAQKRRGRRTFLAISQTQQNSGDDFYERNDMKSIMILAVRHSLLDKKLEEVSMRCEGT